MTGLRLPPSSTAVTRASGGVRSRAWCHECDGVWRGARRPPRCSMLSCHGRPALRSPPPRSPVHVPLVRPTRRPRARHRWCGAASSAWAGLRTRALPGPDRNRNRNRTRCRLVRTAGSRCRGRHGRPGPHPALSDAATRMWSFWRGHGEGRSGRDLDGCGIWHAKINVY